MEGDTPLLAQDQSGCSGLPILPWAALGTVLHLCCLWAPGLRARLGFISTLLRCVVLGIQ